ncbi:MAG: EF-hand domain-containing protein [Sphingomonadales bacterium]|jgi:hypothetical protein
MRHTLLALALLASPASAQMGRQMFVSPAGEPFRAPADAPYPVADWFAQADADHDGKLTRSEFIADGMRFFATLDQDKDGRLLPPEIDRYENVVLTDSSATILADGKSPGAGPPTDSGKLGREDDVARKVMRDARSRMGGGGTDPKEAALHAQNVMAAAAQMVSGVARYGLIASPQPVKAGDMDMDGSVSSSEFRRLLSRRFDTLDPDNTGELLLKDLPETLAQQVAPKRKKK